MADSEDTPALVASDAPGSNAPALSVSELSGALKRTVEDTFGYVRVRGEISGWKRHASGHCYMTLKDEGAAMDGVLWRGSAQRLRFRPEDGVEVVATGRLTTYPGRSKYQIVIDKLEVAGAGALMALLDQRRRTLAAEGLFDPARRRPLPYLPRVIGVITSPTGAVIRDILHRLGERCPSHVVVWPVPVQGEGAAAKIAAAVAGFGALPVGGAISRPDLLILARGGGSIEDLWAFNEEEVVRAVAASAIPIICAVGHETDTSLADHAADRRAPTPTAAAEFAVPVRAELAAGLNEAGARLSRSTFRALEQRRERAAQAARRLPPLDRLLGPQRQRLDLLAPRLPAALQRRLGRAEARLAGVALRPALLAQRLERARLRFAAARLRPEPLARRLRDARESLDRLWRVALAADPNLPLQRGFARVEAAHGALVTSAADAREAPRLRLYFADGVVPVRPLVERTAARAYPAGKTEQSSLFGD